MSFSGKSTYSAGATLPEIAEDVSDLITINSPHETPLLDALGDPARVARSTVHEWLEDALSPSSDTIATVVDTNTIAVQHPAWFREGDLIRFEGGSEVAMITAIDPTNSRLSLSRGYGSTSPATLVAGLSVMIIGNAALEGADANAARFSNRQRRSNYTQIFTATVSVSGSQQAVDTLGVRDELTYQKNLRTRELLRDLENCVINGMAATTTPEGSGTVRRTMRGLIGSISANTFMPGDDYLPSDTPLTEPVLNTALRTVWQKSSGNIDLIVVNGREKRRINEFVSTNRRFTTMSDSYRDMVSTYESDFGACRVVLSRYVPVGTVLLLDSSRISVLPLAGRSFNYTPLARTGDAETGQIVGEYTLEVRGENTHAVITGLAS